MEETRQAQVYGVRPPRTFEQAAAKFVLENGHKRSIADDISLLKQLLPWLGSVQLHRIQLGTLQPWIERRRAAGKAAGTINHGIKIVRRILNLAATEWVDEHGMTWLSAAPRLRLLPDHDKRRPYPLSWCEQSLLFGALPAYLAQMALFAVNTGCRDQEICGLRWDWEVKVPELGATVFIIPGPHVKNTDDRLVVLNAVATSVVEARRGRHPQWVFTYQGRPLSRMMTKAWKQARIDIGLPQVRIHDLKHTFGRRLRAAGVSFEDRQDLLGHRSGRITTHYSAAELSRLIAAANTVVDRGDGMPELVVLKGALHGASRKTPASDLASLRNSTQVLENVGGCTRTRT